MLSKTNRKRKMSIQNRIRTETTEPVDIPFRKKLFTFLFILSRNKIKNIDVASVYLCFKCAIHFVWENKMSEGNDAEERL